MLAKKPVPYFPLSGFNKPKSVIRPYGTFMFNSSPSYVPLPRILLLYFPRRSPLRLRKIQKKSARQLHAIRLKSNDRFGLKTILGHYNHGTGIEYREGVSDMLKAHSLTNDWRHSTFVITDLEQCKDKKIKVEKQAINVGKYECRREGKNHRPCLRRHAIVPGSRSSTRPGKCGGLCGLRRHRCRFRSCRDA